MNLISFANFTQSENQNSFLPLNEKNSNGEDFSLLLNNISVALQTAPAPPVANFQNNLQIQTISETSQNLAFSNNSNLAVNPFVQTANPELKTNIQQTFFSNDLNPQEINSSVINSEIINQPVIKTEIPNPRLQTESVISSLQVKDSVQIPTNFQPAPNLPTMQNLWSENSVKVNLPPIPKPQIPLPDNKNSENFSNEHLAVSNNPLSFKTTIPENAKEFEIVKQPDHFFSDKNLPLVFGLKTENKIAEENIFPQTANLPNISLSDNERTFSEKTAKIEVEFTKALEIQSTVEKPQVVETNFDSFNAKIDSPLNLNQKPEFSGSNSKVEKPNFIPRFNAVLEYPVSQKVQLPRVELPQTDLPKVENLNLIQAENSSSSEKNPTLSVNQKSNFAVYQGVETSIPQNIESPQNPVNSQTTIEIKTETISENPTIQTNFPALNLTFENNIEPTSENSLPQINIPNLQTNFENKVEVIAENPQVLTNIPVSQINVEINPELKAESVLQEVLSVAQPQQNPLPKIEIPTENKISEVDPPVIKAEPNPVENKEIKAEVKPALESENEFIVEAQKPKIENYELKSQLKTRQKEPSLETKILPLSNELQSSESVLNEPQSVEFVSNKVELEVKSYEVKPLNIVSQKIEEISVNQPIQNIPNEEAADEESINTNFEKFSLPAEEKVIPQSNAKTFTLNTENTEPISFETTAENAKSPQTTPEKDLTANFAEKVEPSKQRAVSTENKNSEADFDEVTKSNVQNHELSINQKQNETQKVVINESVQTKTNVKISETSLSKSSPYFNLSDKSEQEKKFNDPQNDLTVNFDKIFDNIIKKKETVEATSKTQTEPTEIAEQVTPELLQMAGLVEKKNGKEILKLRLNPAELGTVEITLEKNSSGVLSAHFKTENESARQALSNGLEQLRDTLQNNGWNIGQMEISNGSSSSTNHQPQQHNQQKSEWIENFSFNRSSEKPDDSENNSPARLLNLLA
jgi:flagellar hook-length control protein FliK